MVTKSIALSDKSQYRSSRGFSLTEMMIIIAIIGTLSSIAIPPFISWRNKTAVRSACYHVKSILEQAKMAAVRQRRTVSVDLNNNKITAYIRNAKSTSYTPKTDTFIAQEHFKGVFITKTNSISFNSRGIGPALTVKISNSEITENSFIRNVVVNSVGRVYIR